MDDFNAQELRQLWTLEDRVKALEAAVEELREWQHADSQEKREE